MNFFLSFYINPGGQNSHRGGLGSDSGGENHEKIDYLEKLISFEKIKKIRFCVGVLR